VSRLHCHDHGGGFGRGVACREEFTPRSALPARMLVIAVFEPVCQQEKEPKKKALLSASKRCLTRSRHPDGPVNSSRMKRAPSCSPTVLTEAFFASFRLLQAVANLPESFSPSGDENTFESAEVTDDAVFTYLIDH
jgi:hypothetical protein